MKTTKIILGIALVTGLLVFAAIGLAETENSAISSSVSDFAVSTGESIAATDMPTIEYKNSDTAVMNDLVVTPTTADYKIYDASGNMVQEYKSPIDSERYASLVQMMNDNGFLQMSSDYTNGTRTLYTNDTQTLNSGTSQISYATADMTKSVTIGEDTQINQVPMQVYDVKAELDHIAFMTQVGNVNSDSTLLSDSDALPVSYTTGGTTLSTRGGVVYSQPTVTPTVKGFAEDSDLDSPVLPGVAAAVNEVGLPNVPASTGSSQSMGSSGSGY